MRSCQKVAEKTVRSHTVKPRFNEPFKNEILGKKNDTPARPLNLKRIQNLDITTNQFPSALREVSLYFLLKPTLSRNTFAF